MLLSYFALSAVWREVNWMFFFLFVSNEVEMIFVSDFDWRFLPGFLFIEHFPVLSIRWVIIKCIKLQLSAAFKRTHSERCIYKMLSRNFATLLIKNKTKSNFFCLSRFGSWRMFQNSLLSLLQFKCEMQYFDIIVLDE